MTTYTTRPPLSFTTTTYDAPIGYDSDIAYSGITIFDTNYTTRPTITTNYNGRGKATKFLMTQALDFLMTQDNNYIVLQDSYADTIYTVRPAI